MKEINQHVVAKGIKALRSGKDKDGPFFAEKHQKLSKEDKFVEDFILTGLYLIKKLKIKNVIRFECDFMDRNNCPLRAVLQDGAIIPLDFDTYIDLNTPRQYAYLYEAQSLINQGVKPNPISKKIKERSPAYLEEWAKSKK